MRIWLSVSSDGGVEQQLDEAPDGGDRRAQLVRDRGHHVVLHLGQLAQPVVLLDEGLRHFLLDGEEALPVGGQLLALGHVDGHHDVAPVGGRRSVVARLGRRPFGRDGRLVLGVLGVVDPFLVEGEVRRRHGEGAHPDHAAPLLAVLAGGGPGHLGRRLGIDRARARCAWRRWSGDARRSGPGR